MPNPMMQNSWADARQAAMSQMQGDMGANQVTQDPDKAMMEQLNSKMDAILAMLQNMAGGGMIQR